MKLYRFEHSTNCERVELAMKVKGIQAERVEIDPADRSLVRRISGQDLVPVLDHDGTIVIDSMAIVRHLDRSFAEPPLYPGEPARCAEMLVFIDWFNRVWKRPPNGIDGELRKPSPDTGRIERLGKAMRDALDLFEQMLAGREFLMGDFSAADCAAFPFLRPGLLALPEGDDELFHKILVDHQPVEPDHPRLADWIRRVERIATA